MCCLFGLLDYGDVWTAKQKERILSVLAIECEERGIDATGISYNNKGQMHIYKRPLPAHQMKFSIPKDTQYIMGHTRLTTQGNENLNYNNHPFSGWDKNGAFSVAHNGMLWNDKQLRIKENLPKTQIETDSYIIVQLLEQAGEVSFENLGHTAETIRGSFTFTVLNENNDLYFVKGDNPLYIYQFDGFYIYASTESILQSALKLLRIPWKNSRSISLACGDILRIDRNGKLEISTFDTAQFDQWEFTCYPSSLYTPYSIYRSNTHEQELIEYASSFGVDPEKIALLLEFGYNADEIEELLYCPNLMQNCLAECYELLFI